ncbi:MAG: chromosome segregation protein SMC [Nitrospirae bacterium]|nr:MAG: chromosome segregation protein SMC [Nitrospirota bacterium]
MRIDKIELIGFKSFADRTAFNLHSGITCIVGPNGCGKSNIVDAFRWVLGEQSAKSLRGEKMEEVIFNGSSLKKQKGMAEVTMVMSGMTGALQPAARENVPAGEQDDATAGDQGNGNGDNRQPSLGLNLASGETLSVTRRLYRSGESEYMINRTPCRLKDIRDIFLDTGLDFRSYSILEQGRISQILNSKPTERRFIIEEVAGVMKYKVRKAEALSKLESSRLNLLRINDIVTEVKKQINILDRLAKKAERYKRLSSEMHAIELKIERKEYQDLRDENEKINGEYTLLRENEAVLSAEITGAENRTETRRLELIEREKALEIIQKNLQLMEREIAEIERTIAVSRNDVTNLGDYKTKLLVQEEENDARVLEITARCGELQAEGQRISGEMEQHAEQLRLKTEAFRAGEEELAEKEEGLEEKRRDIFRVTEEISRLRNELSRQQSAFESLERRDAAAQRESEDSRKVLEGVEASINNVESVIMGNSNEKLLMHEKKTVLAEELSIGKSQLEELLRNLADQREDLASSQSRLESLKELVFDKPTRDLISSRSDIKLLGSLSDVVEVDARYEKAVESALSEKADMLILESAEAVEHAVVSLRGAGSSRTAFMAQVPPATSYPAELPAGVIGRAIDFVRVREGYSQVAGNILNNILITQDIHSAFEGLQSTSGRYTFVTVDGEVLEPSGAVIIGEGKGIFRRKREIRELDELIEAKKAGIASLNDRIQDLQSGIAEKEEIIRAVESSINNLEKEISLSKLTVQNYSEEKERTSRKLSYLTLEMEEAAREKEMLTGVLAETNRTLQEIEARKAAIEADAAQIQEEIAGRKSLIEEHRAEVTDLRLLTASNREKVEAIRKEIDSSQRTIAEIGRKKTELIAERDSLDQKIRGREAEILEHETKLRKAIADADVLRIEIGGKKENIEKENEELIAIEHGLRDLRQQLSSVVHRISDLDVQKAEHKMRIENIALQVKNNYGVEIDTLELEEITPEEQEKLADLRAKIQEMGAVNLGTLEEYEELRTRYEFMSRQQEDLSKSIAELEEAISKINSTTRKKLRDAFEMLNSKFGEVFVTLFGGGRAELVLTDESNILETGIEIVAQPPGKKIQNIHLLSGGEQALTALSLQFGGFLIKPTPLCILDEADAPLDESNTERYSKMLHNLSQETQFIVVTHNRTTMSVAQHLYGITMQEAGVSKVISMQLEDVPA